MSSTRRDLLLASGKAFAAQAVAGVLGAPAKARASGGRIKAVAFDAFTVFDILSVDAVIEGIFRGKGMTLGAAWRTKQFEYSWLRTLSRTYVDFWRVTEDALVFTFKAAKIQLTNDTRDRIMLAYLELKAWPDSAPALSAMRAAGIRLVYLSNMTVEMMTANTNQAGLATLFEQALSTDAVKAFKPDPLAYRMAEAALHLPRENILFAAFGGWDAAGAKSFGFETFWVNRLNAPLEELGIKPDATGTTLTDLAEYVTA
jgi:2-haloacid dehalogenase